jgi:hypothetical protein
MMMMMMMMINLPTDQYSHDSNVNIKGTDELSQYKDLEIEVIRMWRVRTKLCSCKWTIRSNYEKAQKGTVFKFCNIAVVPLYYVSLNAGHCSDITTKWQFFRTGGGILYN